MESVTQKKIKASELRSLGDRRTEQQADSVAETDRGEDAITSQELDKCKRGTRSGVYFGATAASISEASVA